VVVGDGDIDVVALHHPLELLRVRHLGDPRAVELAGDLPPDEGPVVGRVVDEHDVEAFVPTHRRLRPVGYRGSSR
jgi:hypothetical protein